MVVKAPSKEQPPAGSRMESFRESYRHREVRRAYNGWAHLLFVLAGSITAMAVALSFVESPTFLEWLCIPITLLIANIVEYVGHRGPMHKPLRGMYVLFDRHAKVHHQFFDDEWMVCESSRDHHIVLFPPLMLLFYLGLIAFPLAALVYFMTTPNRAYFAFASAVFYYLSYELLHFAYHVHPESFVGRLPMIAKLREHHRVHHSHKLMATHNFNITWPIGDLLFGTVYRMDRSNSLADAQQPADESLSTPLKHDETQKAA